MDLNSFQTYLNAQLPRLAGLHTLLALPATELSADHARLDAAIRSAVSGVIESREIEVQTWRGKIAAARVRVTRFCDGLSVVGDDRELATAADAVDVGCGRSARREHRLMNPFVAHAKTAESPRGQRGVSERGEKLCSR